MANSTNTTTHLGLAGLTCGSCTSSTTKVLTALPGVVSVDVELTAAVVIHDTALVSRERLVETIEEAGFEAWLDDEKNGTAAPTTATATASTTTVCDVKGMTCGSCVASITQVVSALPGVAAVQVSLEEEEARVEHDPLLCGSEVIREAIDDAGFVATLVSDTQESPPESSGPITTLIGVDGMTCGSCVASITKQVSAEDGVESVDVSLDDKLATIVHDPSLVSPDKLAEVIEGCGFDATLQGAPVVAPVLAPPPSKPRAAPGPVTSVIGVEGMTCNSCVQSITKQCNAEDGVVSTHVSLEEKSATIVHDPRTVSVARLAEVIEDAGFDATPRAASGAASTAGKAAKARPSRTVSFGTGVGSGGVVTRDFDINYMTCGNCVESIEKGLTAKPGVLTCHVSLERARASVEFNSSLVTPGDICAWVGELGYEASLRDMDPVKGSGVGDAFRGQARVHTRVTGLSANGGSRAVSRRSSASEGVVGVLVPRGSYKRAYFAIENMKCGSCVNKIEKHFRRVRGVISITVALLAKRGEIEYDDDLLTVAEIVDEFVAVGFPAEEIHEASAGVAELCISGMTCGSCVSKIERAVSRMDGVLGVQVSLATKKAHIEYDPENTGVRDIIQSINDMETFAATLATGEVDVDRLTGKEETEHYKYLFRLSLWFTVPTILIHMVLPWIPFFQSILTKPFLPHVTWANFFLLMLSTPVQFYLGKPFYQNGWASCKHRAPSMDLLVALATTISYFYSLIALFYGAMIDGYEPEVFFETSTMLISFILLGRMLESVAKGKTSAAITKLIGLQPKNATLLKYDGEGVLVSQEEISVDMVQRGDFLRVVPGSRVPADGVVVEGRSSVDESMITGEPMPAVKVKDSPVIAGTINQHGAFVMTATRVGTETALSQIVKLVEAAQVSKAPIQSFADKVAGVFVPGVLTLSLTTFLVWLGITSAGVDVACMASFHGSHFMFAVKLGVSVLVIACPCALGLATPTAVMVGTGVGAENGVLIKGGYALETCHRINHIVLDKTGTITVGKPAVVNVTLFTGRDEREVMFLAGSAEASSEHVLGQAIVTYARDVHGAVLVEAEDFAAESGFGISAGVDGHEVVVGTRKWMGRCGIALDPAISAGMEGAESRGHTVVIVAIDGTVSATVSIADPIKDESYDAIKMFKKLGLGISMVTGDNRRAAGFVARQLGIDSVFAEVLPAHKSEKVKELQGKGKVVAMVGDGINDSPALVEADIGIAIGAGTEVALEAADVVLIRSNLCDVAMAVDLSRVTFNRIKLNFVWATVYNLIGVPLAAGVFCPLGLVIPPYVAGLCMAMSSVTVVMSSLHLKYYKRPEATIAKTSRFTLGGRSPGGRYARLDGGELESADVSDASAWSSAAGSASSDDAAALLV